MHLPSLSPSRRLVALGAAALLATLPGCMTAMSQMSYVTDQCPDGMFDPTAVIYGGTRVHARILAGATAHDALFGDWLLVVFEIVDLPLSFVADTVLLPVTLLERATMHVPADEPPQ